MPRTAFLPPLPMAAPHGNASTLRGNHVCESAPTPTVQAAPSSVRTPARPPVEMTAAIPVPTPHIPTTSVGVHPSTAPSTVPSTPAAPTPGAPQSEEPVVPIVGQDAFRNAIQTNSHRPVIIKVYAPWCRSCKALEPKVRRLAREFSQIAFFEIDFENIANKSLCYDLGVSSMPTFFIYAGEAGQIDKFTCGPKRAHILRTKVEQLLAGECEYDGSET